MAGADHKALEAHWRDATQRCSDDGYLKQKFYHQLIRRHSSIRRRYHNLNHIGHLLNCIDEYRDRLKNPVELKLAVWYHDAVYRPLRKDSEQRSADLAVKHLTALGYDALSTQRIYKLILATKDHELSGALNDFDAQFFMDIDLSILGAHREQYVKYMWQIRKELVLVPRFLYKTGRIKALEGLLGLKHIYRTDIFQPLEKRARENMKQEIQHWERSIWQ